MQVFSQFRNWTSWCPVSKLRKYQFRHWWYLQSMNAHKYKSLSLYSNRIKMVAIAAVCLIWKPTICHRNDLVWVSSHTPVLLTREKIPRVKKTVKRLESDTPEVNLRNPLHAGEEAHKWLVHPGFETQGRQHHQNSKTGVSVAPQKD